MKTFKQYIQEDVKWTNDIMYYITGLFIPLTPTSIKRIFGNRPRIKAFHISNFENFKKLEKLQGTKKSVSCGLNFKPDRYRGGIHAGGGIVSVVEGYPLVDLYTDAMTQVDKQGRRWISSFQTGQKLKHGSQEVFLKLESDFAVMKINVFKKYVPSLSSYDKISQTTLDSLDKKVKYNIIKMYIDETEKYIKKNLDLFTKMFYDSDFSDNFKGDWTEQVLTEIKIDKVYLIYEFSNDSNSLTREGKEYIDEGYDKKYKTEPIFFNDIDHTNLS